MRARLRSWHAPPHVGNAGLRALHAAIADPDRRPRVSLKDRRRRNEVRRMTSADLVAGRGRQSRGPGLRKLMTLTMTTIAEANDAKARATNAHHSSANRAAMARSVAETGRL
jgi:hypothetical protein